MWSNFYKNRINNSYSNHIRTHYSLFLEEIEKRINTNSKVLEIGCGIGSITKLLKPKSKYLISDINQQMLNLSFLNTKRKGFIYDIKTPLNSKVDLIHSHGVLEHFSDTEIYSIIKNQLNCTKNLIHYVPSNKYKTKSFGDENLWSKEEWEKICNPNKIIEFNNKYDLMLIWE